LKRLATAKSPVPPTYNQGVKTGLMRRAAHRRSESTNQMIAWTLLLNHTPTNND